MTAVHGFGSIKHVRIGGLIAKRWPVVGGVLLVAARGWATWQALQHPRGPDYLGGPLVGAYWRWCTERRRKDNSLQPRGVEGWRSERRRLPQHCQPALREDRV